MFLLKKIIGLLCNPLSLGLMILILGLLLLWFTRRRKTGRAVVSVGTILLIAMSYGWFPALLARPLESRYPPLMQVEALPKVEWIVVLGGGHVSDPSRPAASQLAGASRSRVMEGVRLHRALPGTKLVLSGGAICDPVPEARTMADAAAALGVNRGDMILESISRDTEEQALRIRQIVGDGPFILVTSAIHMPRSVALFRKLGLRLIPAPTDFRIHREQSGLNPALFFPGTGHLSTAEDAIHEYLGTAWASLRGRI